MDIFIIKMHVTATPIKILMMESSEIIDQKTLFFVRIASNAILAQMGTKKHIEIFGETDVSEMLKKNSQLEKGVTPCKTLVRRTAVSTLASVHARSTVDTVHLIKEKFSRAIKGLTCANGSKRNIFE